MRIDACDMKNALEHLFDFLEAGEAFTVTRNGKAVARFRARASALRLGRFDWAEWKEYLDERRREREQNG